MCHLNILLKRTSKLNRLHTTKVTGFLQTVTALSYDSNSDGDGVFFSKGLLAKSTLKLNLTKYKDAIKNSDYLLGHQRFSTSGRTEEYTQPFQMGNFVLIHNGVVSSYAKGKHSDTFGLFKTFMKHFNNSKKGQVEKTREEKVRASLRSLFNSLGTYGSYSIGLYDLKDKCMYYFKDYTRNISMFKSENYTYLTTDKTNGDYVHMLDEAFVEETILSKELYRFDVTDEGIDMKRLGTIGTAKATKIKKKKVVKTTKYLNWRKDAEALDEEEGEDNDLEGMIARECLGVPLPKRLLKEHFLGDCSICQGKCYTVDSLNADFLCLDCAEDYMEQRAEQGMCKWDTSDAKEMWADMGEEWY